MMLLSIFFYPVIFLILLLPRPSDETYGQDTALRMKLKQGKMISELIKDVHMKIQSIDHIKRTYYKNTIFQVGELVFSIKRKYKRMLHLYQISEDQESEKKIDNLVECQQLNMDIDKLIDMIEEYEWKRKKRSEIHNKFNLTLRTQEHDQENEEKKRKALRTQMAKIKNLNEKSIVQKQRHMEDGFDTE